MSETLRDHTIAWLDSIGADGLMNDGEDFIHKDDLGDDALDEFFAMSEASQMVPAYRHADGSYHIWQEEPCISCQENRKKRCIEDSHKPECGWHQAWLAHKEATK